MVWRMRNPGKADDLSLIVNAKRGAARFTGKRGQRLHSRGRGPDESLVIGGAGVVAGNIGKADHCALVVDSRGSIPGFAAQASEIHRNTVFPEHGMTGAEASDTLIANAGDTHNLAAVIDCGCGGHGVTGPGERRQFLHLVWVWSPYHRAELQYLGGEWTASGIVNRVFCPAYDLAAIVGRCGVAVGAAQRG